MDVLLQPFQFEFFRNGTIAAILVGGLCGLLGVYIVLRGMSYIGHGLSHAIFGGAVVTYVMAWNFYIGAGLWGFLAAVLINQTVRRTRIFADAAIGVVTTASFAIGVALISRYRHFTRSFDAALFGNILGVTVQDVVVVAAALVIPAITARLLTDSFNRMIVLSTLIGMLTNLLGMYLSYYIDVASGATIVQIGRAH